LEDLASFREKKQKKFPMFPQFPCALYQDRRYGAMSEHTRHLMDYCTELRQYINEVELKCKSNHKQVVVYGANMKQFVDRLELCEQEVQRVLEKVKRIHFLLED